jgi:TolB-like protein
MSLLAELKRRNVFRVAVMYLAVSWLVLQATDVIGSLLGLPSWAGKLVILLLVIGFPAALVFSWLYELTPEGVQRDKSVDSDASSRRDTARRLNLLTIAAAVLALLVVAVDRMVPEDRAPTETSKGPVAIAVLPFIDLSSDKDQEHFGDGIAEEVLNLLANVQGLRVTSRTSSFSFKAQTAALPTIATKLGVSHIVEGSVRKSGTRMRVTAQLINVASDEHIWSETYERELTDVFAIQSDVAGQIARVLTTALSADEASLIGERPTNSLAAWQNFVAARNIYRSRLNADDIDRAISLVDDAIEQDENFARAYSLRAALLLGPVFFGGLGRDEAASLQEAIRTAEHALKLAPQLGEPWFVLAQAAYWEGRLEDADRYFRQGVSRAPNNADGRNWYGTFLISAGYLQRGWTEEQRAIELDPLSPVISWQAAFAALAAGRLDAVLAYTVKARENGWPNWQPSAIAAGVALQKGQFDEAEVQYLAAMPPLQEDVAMAFEAIRSGRIDAATRELLDTLSAYGPPGAARWNTEVLAGDIDAAFKTAWDNLDPNSLIDADGNGGPPRLASGRIGELLRADWWFASASGFRKDPRFPELMRAVGLLAFWQKNGWPDLCQPVGDTLQCR